MRDRMKTKRKKTPRHKVQQLLSKNKAPKSRREKLWDFINSAIFLWILSSVVIGAGGFIYSRWEKKRTEQHKKDDYQKSLERETKATIGKLDAELSSRLNYLNSLLESDFPSLQTETLMKGLLALEKPSTASYPVNVFPEYANRNFQSLLLELVNLVPEKEKEEIQIAYDSAKDLPSVYVAGNQPPPQPNKNNDNYAEYNYESRHRPQKITVYARSNTRAHEFLNGFWLWQMTVFNKERWGKPFRIFEKLSQKKE